MAIAVAVTALAGVSKPARAADQRPCVSKVEYQSMAGLMVRQPSKFLRHEVEERWEVRGLGVLDMTDDGVPEVQFRYYPACAYPRTAVQVWAAYNTETQKLVGIGREGSGSHAVPDGQP